MTHQVGCVRGARPLAIKVCDTLLGFILFSHLPLVDPPATNSNTLESSHNANKEETMDLAVSYVLLSFPLIALLDRHLLILSNLPVIHPDSVALDPIRCMQSAPVDAKPPVLTDTPSSMSVLASCSTHFVGVTDP
jgi:hypothetical protein